MESGHEDHGHGTHEVARIEGKRNELLPNENKVCITALPNFNKGLCKHVISSINHVISALQQPTHQNTIGVMCISLGVQAPHEYMDLDNVVSKSIT